MKRFLYLVVLGLFLFPEFALPCSALIFKENDHTITAANLDWMFQEGIVAIHPRNMVHVAEVDRQKYRPLMWKSRYGTVIFHGGDLKKLGPAADGMNEQGLSAFILVLMSSQYGQIDSSRPTLDTSHWVQYVLDNFKTVQEVIDNTKYYQLIANNYHGLPMNLHMMVNDKFGHSAILEYLNGQLIIHQDEAISHPALTNDTYDFSIADLGNYQDFGGSLPLPGGYDSKSRYVRAAAYMQRMARGIPEDARIAYAFNGLADVAQAPHTPSPTQFSMVFDLNAKKLYFRSINEPAIRSINLAEINFENLTKEVKLEVFRHLAGDVLPAFEESA